MHTYPLHPVPADLAAKAWVDQARYEAMYAASIDNPEAFWADQGQRLDWMSPYTRVKNTDYTLGQVSIRWYEDGELNVSANCIDRHLVERGEQTAIIWEGDDPSEDQRISYRELHQAVCQLANGLKALGIRKGDVVTIYMPMIPEAAYAMLACARIGAIHSVVFGGFSPDALANRVEDGQSKLIITADEGIRGGKTIPLKANVDKALSLPGAACCTQVLMVRRTGAQVPMQAGRDVDYAELVGAQSADCPAEPMKAEDPLFILYTSGSTGKPKGVLHTSGGYLVYASMTHQYVFDYHPGDIYWCTADVGWVTGHSYIVY
ncbi:MAG: AMP-binding protein, partial [Oceanococcaceae bacterium]